MDLAKSEDRNMGQEMTGWFSGLVRPTRKGVYQTKANDIPGYLWFNYWNGRRWSSGGYGFADDAYKFRHDRQNDDVDYWRGLARPNV